MNHGAESHEHAGVRSMEAMNDWAHECDDDTDLFVFSHGALIENALQVLFGIERRYPDFTLTSMCNAHWARLRRADIDMDSRWIMEDHNHNSPWPIHSIGSAQTLCQRNDRTPQVLACML